MVEEMIEETDEEMCNIVDSSFSRKAKMLPVTFVIKAKKI